MQWHRVTDRLPDDETLVLVYLTDDPADYGDDPMSDAYWVARGYLSLRLLCEELDMEMDGVPVPSTAAAILNAIRRIVNTEPEG